MRLATQCLSCNIVIAVHGIHCRSLANINYPDPGTICPMQLARTDVCLDQRMRCSTYCDVPAWRWSRHQWHSAPNLSPVGESRYVVFVASSLMSCSRVRICEHVHVIHTAVCINWHVFGQPAAVRGRRPTKRTRRQIFTCVLTRYGKPLYGLAGPVQLPRRR